MLIWYKIIFTERNFEIGPHCLHSGSCSVICCECQHCVSIIKGMYLSFFFFFLFLRYYLLCKSAGYVSWKILGEGKFEKMYLLTVII